MEFQDIKQFIDEFKVHQDISIEEDNTTKLEALIPSMDETITQSLEWLKDDSGISLSKNYSDFLKLASIRFAWFKENNDFIYGGFLIADIASGLRKETHFWKPYFGTTRTLTNEKEQFLKNLVCFQRSAWGDDGTFGCLYRDSSNDPFPLYFFDNGAYTKLNLTLNEYYSEMLKSKAVALWQYFYIEPKDMEKMLDGLSCKNWVSLHDDLDNIPRIEGVAIHMERVIESFSSLFPDYDLSFFKSKLSSLNKLLNRK